MIRALQRHTRWPIAALAFALAGAGAMLSAQTAPIGRARPDPAMPGGPFKIAGVVVSDKTGGPLGRARVTIFETANPRSRAATVTGADGHFEFDHLSAGKYSLQGERRGFLPTSYEQHGQFSTAIVTGPSFETQNLTLRLVPGAMISGHIFDESGGPVHRAQVEMYRANRDSGASQVTLAGAEQSDDRGYYELSPLFPGTYYVSADAQPWYAVHPRRSRSEGEASSVQSVDPSLDVSYPTTFCGDTTESDAAAPIVLKGGDHAQVDIHLNPVPSLHLMVHVPESRKNGYSPPTFYKRVFDSVQNVSTEGEQSVSPDTLEITGVPAGRYAVRMSGPSGEAMQIAEMNLTQDGQELDASAGEPLARLTVSVKIAGEEKTPEQLAVILRDSRLQPTGSQTDHNGEAHFEGLRAGKYSIAVFSPGARYVVSQTSLPGAGPGSATSGSSVELAPGAALSLSALVVPGTAKVEGFVKRAGKAAAGIMVVLAPDKPESNLELFRRDQSDFDGSFTLQGVVPGSYTVIAIENGWTLDWSTPAVLARYKPRGEKLTVSPQTAGTVSLPAPVEVQPR